MLKYICVWQGFLNFFKTIPFDKSTQKLLFKTPKTFFCSLSAAQECLE